MFCTWINGNFRDVENVLGCLLVELILQILCFLQAENLLLADKLKIEKEQNAELRNQVAHLLQLEKDQKIQIQERDLNIQTLQVRKCFNPFQIYVQILYLIVFSNMHCCTYF